MRQTSSSTKRVDASWSTGSTRNEMQNIFLEQFEKFEGILIATSNLVELMDSAFSRRFHHKIEFKRPGQRKGLSCGRYIYLKRRLLLLMLI